jgi:5-aminolevulinate synthase
MYGPTGAGVAEHLDFDAYIRSGKTREPISRSVMDRVDIITGASSPFFEFTEFIN